MNERQWTARHERLVLPKVDRAALRSGLTRNGCIVEERDVDHLSGGNRPEDVHGTAKRCSSSADSSSDGPIAVEGAVAHVEPTANDVHGTAAAVAATTVVAVLSQAAGSTLSRVAGEGGSRHLHSRCRLAGRHGEVHTPAEPIARTTAAAVAAGLERRAETTLCAVVEEPTALKGEVALRPDRSTTTVAADAGVAVSQTAAAAARQVGLKRHVVEKQSFGSAESRGGKERSALRDASRTARTADTALTADRAVGLEV